MIAQSCLHIRQTFASWQLHIPIDYTYYLYMPCNLQTPAAKPYLRGELAAFNESLEEWTGKDITDEDLDRAIEVYNANRRLMKEIYQLRKGENPPLTGLEAMQMVVSSQVVDKVDHNILLQEALERLSEDDGCHPGTS